MARGKPVDRTGQRYGKLTVVSIAGRQETNGNLLWLCQCDCGNEVIVNAGNLKTSHTQSCGCMRSQPLGSFPPDEIARNMVLRGYTRSAHKRGLSWELTVDDFDKLTAMDCFYCGQPPNNVKKYQVKYWNGDFIYNGIDRMNNVLGYVLGNVVACCWICNRAKKDMSFGEFIAWFDRASAYRARQNTDHEQAA